LFPKQNALVQNYQPVIGIKIEFWLLLNNQYWLL
jgi:hypothetical protein